MLEGGPQPRRDLLGAVRDALSPLRWDFAKGLAAEALSRCLDDVRNLRDWLYFAFRSYGVSYGGGGSFAYSVASVVFEDPALAQWMLEYVQLLQTPNSDSFLALQLFLTVAAARPRRDSPPDLQCEFGMPGEKGDDWKEDSAMEEDEEMDEDEEKEEKEENPLRYYGRPALESEVMEAVARGGSRAIVLVGGGGAGKSALLDRVRWRLGRRKIRVVSLACAQLQSVAMFLDAAYAAAGMPRLGADASIDLQAAAAAFCGLLRAVARRDSAPTVVIVDALEQGIGRGAEVVASALEASEVPPGVRVVTATRACGELSLRAPHVPRLYMDADRAVRAELDVRGYVDACLAVVASGRSLQDRNALAAYVCAAAGGNFRFASKILAQCWKDPSSAALSRTLSELYTEMFSERMGGRPFDGSPEQDYLGLLAVARERVTSDVINASVDESTASCMYCSWVSELVSVSTIGSRNSRYLLWLDRPLKQWLLSPTNLKFAVRSAQSHRRLAAAAKNALAKSPEIASPYLWRHGIAHADALGVSSVLEIAALLQNSAVDFSVRTAQAASFLPAMINAARVLIDRGRYVLAAKVAEFGVECEPEDSPDPVARLLLFEARAGAGELVRARDDLMLFLNPLLADRCRIRALVLLAHVHAELSQLDLAQQAFRQASEVGPKSSVDDVVAAQIAIVESEIAFCQCQYEDSKRHAAKARELLLKGDDVNMLHVARSWIRTSMADMALGEPTLALESYAQSRSCMDLADRPELASVLQGEADVYEYLARPEAAVRARDEAFKVRVEMLGETHPLVVADLSFIRTGLPPSCTAVEVARRRVEVLMAMFGEHGDQHSEVCRARLHIGDELYAACCYQEALVEHRSVLEILLQRHLPLEAAVARLAVGADLLAIGSSDLAAIEVEAALKARYECLGDRHPLHASALVSQGCVCLERQRFAAALQCFVDARRVLLRVLGSNHPFVVSCTGNVGLALLNLNQWDAAKESFLAEQNAALTWSCDDRNLAFAASLEHFGTYHANCHDRENPCSEDLERALECHQKALDLRLAILGPQNLPVAASMGAIAAVRLAMQDNGVSNDQLTAAVNELDQALVIERRFLGNDHPRVIESSSNRALALAMLHGEDLEHITHDQQSVVDRLEKSSPRHASTASAQFVLARIFTFGGGNGSAAAYFKKAWTLRNSIYGPDHVLTQTAKAAMDKHDQETPSTFQNFVRYIEQHSVTYKTYRWIRGSGGGSSSSSEGN